MAGSASNNWHDFCILQGMSLFEGLNIATRGLAAAQMGINVSGQNMVNANVEGYSRKRIEQNADWRKDAAYGQMGFGVEVYAVNRIRDQFIDRLVNEELTRYGYFSVKDAAYNRIESIFHEPDDAALNSLMNKFWNSWSDLANNPDKAGARETLRSTAETMVGQFQYVMTQMRSYQNTINDEIEARINKINELTTSIDHCNRVVTGSEGPRKSNANDTRDQRDKLLEELAQLINIDYYEDELGAVIVSTSGNMLVSAAKNHEILMRHVAYDSDDGYQHSRIEATWALTGKEFVPTAGEMKALMDIRDIEIPKYQDYINSLARTMITEVNKIHQNAYALTGMTFIDFFDPDPNKFNASKIAISAAVKTNINNIAAAAGGQKVSSPTIDVLPNGVDPIIIGPLTPTPPSSATQLLDLTTFAEDYRYISKNTLEISYTDPISGKTMQLHEGKDYDIDWNTAQITFKYSAVDNAFSDPTGLQVSIKFDYHESGFGGPADGDAALLISQLRDKALMQSDVLGKTTQTMGQFYAGALGRLGVERNEAAAGLDTRTYALQQLKNRQDEVMGVAIDEEMAIMMKYEYTYQASARYFSTINSMLDTLLNM